MVKEIHKQPFEMVGLSASDKPLTEGSLYSKWRKAVINTWKPVTVFLYFMFKENMSNKILKHATVKPWCAIQVRQGKFSLSYFAKRRLKFFSVLAAGAS